MGKRKYNIGQLVRVDFKEIPKEERNCEEGTIVGIKLRFPGTPRQYALVTIRFHDNYVKKGKQWLGGITEISLKDNDTRIKPVSHSRPIGPAVRGDDGRSTGGIARS